mgnify:CR=1 FL=1
MKTSSSWKFWGKKGISKVWAHKNKHKIFLLSTIQKKLSSSCYCCKILYNFNKIHTTTILVINICQQNFCLNRSNCLLILGPKSTTDYAMTIGKYLGFVSGALFILFCCSFIFFILPCTYHISRFVINQPNSADTCLSLSYYLVSIASVALLLACLILPTPWLLIPLAW